MFVSIILLLSPASAYAESSLMVRPQAGYGFLDSANNANVAHAGVRLLLSAGGNKRYGLELTHFRVEGGDSYSSAGIVLEQRLWDWFNMSIGTVGYFSYGANAGNPVGVMTNLGWEPDNHEPFRPFITYRNDFIFSNSTDISHAISAGVTFEF